LLEIGESPQGFPMELRNHPIMICDGVKTWPPKWFQTYGSTNRVVVGEVGLLDTVFLSKLIPPRQVYLVMTTAEDNCYLGSLMFEQADAAEEVFHFLLAHLKQPINQIGSINRRTVRVGRFGVFLRRFAGPDEAASHGSSSSTSSTFWDTELPLHQAIQKERKITACDFECGLQHRFSVVRNLTTARV
jgi:hypothetical protein